MDTTMDRDTLGSKLLPELQQIAQTMGVEGAQKLRKAGLIDAIVAASTNGGDATKPARAKRNGAATAPSAETDAPAAETASDDDEDEADEGNRAPAREERAESAGNDRGNARTAATRIGATRTAARRIAGASGTAAATPTAAAKIAIAPRTGLPPRTAASRTATGTKTAMASSIGADAVPPGRSVAVSAKSGVSRRRPIARRRSRPPPAAPASSTSCPRATGSCGPAATCPGPRTSMCRCRTCASTRCARATP